jgi:hypothetical protein
MPETAAQWSNHSCRLHNMEFLYLGKVKKLIKGKLLHPRAFTQLDRKKSQRFQSFQIVYEEKNI